MQRPYQVGLIGCGDIADIYFENARRFEIIEIAACASRTMANARAKAERHGIATVQTPAELIANPGIDIVLNLTTPDVHAAINLAALAAGKHVYTEKPLAASLEDGHRIMDEAAARGLHVGCAPDTFLGGRLQSARQAIDEGLIGEIVGAGAFVVSPGHEWHHPNPEFFYKPGGGPLLDIAPYYVTALLALLGPVRRCSAMARASFKERTIQSEPRRGQTIAVEVPTHVSGQLEFESGAIGSVLASYDVWDSQLPRMEIYGSRGTLCLPDLDPLHGPNLFGGPLWIKTAQTARWRGLPRPSGFDEWDEVPNTHDYNQNSRGLGLADMAYAIRDGREPRASGRMALHSLEVMYGLLTAASESRVVSIDSGCSRPAPLPKGFPQSEA